MKIQVILLLLLVGCVCNPPYIRHADSCCLDENSNSICDVDEKPKGSPITISTPTPTVEYIPVPAPTLKIVEPSFKVSLEPLKDNIRLVDQAIFIMTIRSSSDSLDRFTISTKDDKWTLSTTPLSNPIILNVAANSKNYIKLILQPNKESIGAGNHSITLDIVSEKDSEERQIDAHISVRT